VSFNWRYPVHTSFKVNLQDAFDSRPDIPALEVAYVGADAKPSVAPRNNNACLLSAPTIISANHDEQDRLIIGASTSATAINTLVETA
jgi:hypothetical protein